MLSFLALAFAQTLPASPDMNAQLFRPSLDASRTFWTDESAVPDQLVAPKLLLHTTHRPLMLDPGAGEPIPLVRDVAQADLMVSGTVDRFRLGVDLPVYLVADGAFAASETGLGDLAFDGKVRLLEEDAPVGLGLNGRVSLPTSTVVNPLGAPNVGWEVSAIADAHLVDDRGLLAANVGLRGGPRTELGDARIDDFLVWRAGAAWDLSDWVALSGELVGQYALSANDVPEMPMEALFGAHFLTDDVNLRIGAGPGLTESVGTPAWRAILGLDFVPRKGDPDSDGDGLRDSVDACPTVAEDVDGVLDDDGCVDPPTGVTVKVVDPDGQVVDAVVTLSGVEGSGPWTLEPGSFVATVQAEGFRPGELPFEVGPGEADKELGLTLGWSMGTVTLATVDAAGQPVEAELRVRGVAVATASRWTGEVRVGEVTVAAKAEGYKLARTKLDVVADGTFEQVFTLEPSKAELKAERIEITESVYFDTGKATIQDRSFALLDEVAAILVEHPVIERLRIEGHTDSRGADSANLNLSQKRADAVRDYLIGKGVEAGRLTAVGYGEAKPLDAREVPAAWEKNRRVDFVVERQKE